MSSITKQALRFGAVGVLNTSLGLASIWLLMWLGASAIASNAIGYGLGLILSFSLNRNWSFESKKFEIPGENGRSDIPKFLIAFFSSWVFNVAVVALGMQITSVSPYLLQIFGMATYTVSFFILCRLWVFSR